MPSLVDDNVTFAGPLAQLNSVEDYMEGIKGMSQIKADIVIQKVFVDGPDVLTWFDLHTTVASPVPVANWLSIMTDEPDNRILECAIEAGASAIVTGDRHLLALKNYRGIGIITVSGLLYTFPEMP